jgi:hypothetical protein
MRKLTVILSILMLVCAIVPQAAATNDSLEVIVTVEKGDYLPGNQIVITVHVFDKDVYVSADDITVSVGYYPSEERVNLTEVQTGVYEGTYTIKPVDTLVTITATANRGTDSDTDYTFFDLEDEVDDEVDFSVAIKLDDPNDYEAEPGDSVEITVTVKENGTLVDPDTFQLRINDMSQSYSHAGTGTYTAIYDIPSALNRGDRYDIDAYAEKDNMDDFDSDSFYVMFFMVCYHEITKTNTSTTFDIYVSDMTGKAVVGASVSISYDDDDFGGTPEITQDGTTDSQGKARFTITYQEMSNIDVEGTVTHGTNSQDFDGTIWISTGMGIIPEEPRDEGFDVIDTGDLKVYLPGDTVNRQYIAYMDAIPWANKEIYYYVTEGYSPPYEVIKKGTVNTDSSGRFSVTFTAPQEMVILNFKTGRPKTPEDYIYDEDDDLVYDGDMEFVITSSGADLPMLDWDDDVSVSVDKLMVGGPTAVRVSAGSVPSDARVIAAWFVGSAEEYLDMVTTAAFNYQWQCWTGMSGTVLSKTNGNYAGELLLPEFMPQDEDYTIIAGWISSDGEAHMNYVVLKPGESGGSKSGDDDGVDSDVFILIGVLVIILIILLVVVKAATKPKKKGPM